MGAAWTPYVNSGRANLRTFTLRFSEYMNVFCATITSWSFEKGDGMCCVRFVNSGILRSSLRREV